MSKPKITKKLATVAAIVATTATLTYQYSRSDYKHWIDADRDCQDTRTEILISESLEKVTLDKAGCEVLKGRWYDPYTDQYFINPGDLDVDHFVPLKEVDRSGGSAWTKDKKMQYANDLNNPETLIAVDKSANRSKGDRDPSDWLPPNQKYRCEYISLWQKVKKKWQLKEDEKEQIFLQNMSKKCKNK